MAVIASHVGPFVASRFSGAAASTLRAGADQGSALRFVGALTARQEVAEAIQTQLAIKRQLRQAWLREQQASRQGMATQAFVPQAPPFAGNEKGELSTTARHLLSDYRAFLEGNPIHLCLNMGSRVSFQSRRLVAERLLSKFYGLSGSSLQDAVEGVCLPLGGDDTGSGAGSGGSGGSGGGGGQREGREGGSLSVSEESVAISEASQLPAQANGLSAGLRDYLLSELALSRPGLTEAQRANAHRRKLGLFKDDPSALQAAQELALASVQRIEEGQSMVAEYSAKTAVLGTGGLHDVCNHLLSLYPAPSVMGAIASLINSVEVLGQARSYKNDGHALSDCLTRIRNLSVIVLVMEKTERLKTRLLGALNAGKLPSDESLWRSICKVTQSRSAEPLLLVMQEGDMTPLVRRSFLQEMMGILRELPIAAWSDKDSRANVLSGLGDMTGMMVALSSPTKF